MIDNYQPALYEEVRTFQKPSNSISKNFIIINREESFTKDLLFVRKTLIENHPGMHNQLDPDFSQQLEKNFASALEKLSNAGTDEEKAKIIEEFGESFHDSHLGVFYKSTNQNSPATVRIMPRFGIEKLINGTAWIHLHTFEPKQEEIAKLNELITALPSLRSQKVVIDIRGNGGGDSTWGDELLKSLFGVEHVNEALFKANQAVYTEWRASPENIEHAKGLVEQLKGEFGETHPMIKQMEITYEGMLTAYSKGESFYSDTGSPPPQSASSAPKLFNGPLIVIIDRKCGSACLDFIDSLKALNANISFLGETTNADSVYMELRRVALPSNKGFLGYPIKVYRNRPRGHNVPYHPDIPYTGDLQETHKLQNFVITHFIRH